MILTVFFPFRSQDDVSIALSVSSCEDDKSKFEVKEPPKPVEVEIPKKTIIIMDEPPVPHPLLMKSLTLSQHDSLRGTMMGKWNTYHEYLLNKKQFWKVADVYLFVC